MRWRWRPKSDGVVGLCPQPAAAIAATTRPCQNFRTAKNNAESAATKAAYAGGSRDLLSFRRDSVHVTQAISERLHDVRRKVWRLLHEKMEPPPINLRHPRWRLYHRAGRPWAVIDPDFTVSSTKSPNKMSISPSSKTNIFSPFSPSLKRNSSGPSCNASDSCRKSSAGFTKRRAYKGRATSAKLRFCDNALEGRL